MSVAGPTSFVAVRRPARGPCTGGVPTMAPDASHAGGQSMRLGEAEVGDQGVRSEAPPLSRKRQRGRVTLLPLAV